MRALAYRVASASTGTNSRGQQYLDALASEIGWGVDRLKTWSMAWLHDALQREHASSDGRVPEVDCVGQRMPWSEQVPARLRSPILEARPTRLRLT